MENYHQQLVIGNLLSSYREHVVFYYHNRQKKHIARGESSDIEEAMVEELCIAHNQFISS